MIDKRCERGPLLSLFQILCGAGCANRYTHIRGWREGRMEGRREGGIEGQKCRHEHAMILAVPTTQGKKREKRRRGMTENTSRPVAQPRSDVFECRFANAGDYTGL